MTNGNLSAARIDDQRLRIGQRRGTGRGIADVTDRASALKSFQVLRRKDLRNEPHVDVPGKGSIRSGSRYDTGTFLPPMLEGKKTVIRENSGIWMSVNGKNAALMGWFMVLHSGQGEAGD